MQHSERIFDELISSIQKRQAEMREKISAQEKEVQEVENHIQTLEQEIRTLQKDNDTLEPLLHTEDHIHFFQVIESNSEKIYLRNYAKVFFFFFLIVVLDAFFLIIELPFLFGIPFIHNLTKGF